MRILLGCVGVTAMLLAPIAAFADERKVMLSVDNMWCATCPYMVRRTLADVPGVSDVEVSFEQKTAVVTFDDGETSVAVLTAATTDVGFPSRPLEGVAQ